MLKSFRTQLALAFGLVSLAVAAVLSWQLGGLLTREGIAERGRALEMVAADTALLLGEGLHERMREVSLLAQSGDARRNGADGEAWRDEIERLKASRLHYAWIGVTDAAGVVRGASGKLLVGANVGQRPWFQSALRGDFVGDVHPAKLLASLLTGGADGEPLRFLDFASPLRGPQGDTIGTLAVHADWRWAAEVINLVRRPDMRDAGTRVFILDRRGEVIHHPAGPDASIKLDDGVTPPRQPELLTWSDGKRYLTVAAPLRARTPLTDLGWTVVVRQPEAQALAAVVRAQRAVWEIAAVVALLSMAAAWLLATHIGKPLSAIAAAAQRIGAGELRTEVPLAGQTSELGHLSRSIAAMVAKLVARERALAEAKNDLERRVAERTAELEVANGKLERLAHEDKLTGLPNRRAADQWLERELALHRRHGRDLGVLLIDIDHFKRVNDSHGHAVGDEVLCAVARCIEGALRASDAAARFGGEEFVVLLPETDLPGVAAAGEKLRAAVAAMTLDVVGAVTVSLGGAVADGVLDDAASLLRRADDALYDAKGDGRNRVVVSARTRLDLEAVPQELEATAEAA